MPFAATSYVNGKNMQDREGACNVLPGEDGEMDRAGRDGANASELAGADKD